MTILAIDPGTTESAYLFLYNGKIGEFGKIKNEEVLDIIEGRSYDYLIIEGVVSYGMPIGQDTLKTVMWIGRMYEGFLEYGNGGGGGSVNDIFVVSRQEIKMVLIGMTRGVKDGNIRQYLVDRYGPQGTKPKPGPTYGIAGDVWSALAIATYFMDCKKDNLKIRNLM